MDCRNLTLFILLQTIIRGFASKDFAEKHSEPTSIFRHMLYFKKVCLCNRKNMLSVGIFHQRHKS